MPKAHAIHDSKDRHEQEHAQRAKPYSLVEGRSDGKIEGRTGFVPDAIGIGRDNKKSILPGTQVRIKNLAAGAGVQPVAVMPLEPVAKLYVLGNEKTRRRVSNLEITSQRRKFKA